MNIYLTGGDQTGWALDTDFRLAKVALENFAVVQKKLYNSDFIHSVWPNQYYELIRYSKRDLPAPFVAVFQGDPIRIFENTPGFLEFCQKSYCVAQSTDAEEKLKKLNINNVSMIPYISDMESFYPLKNKNLKNKFNVPDDKFIIGNFMRDSLGSNLMKIKPEKGPDIFCEIVHGASNIIGKNNLHILLGGPRRHWIINRLEQMGISYTYIGQKIESDDFKVNLLNSSVINELINISDLVMVTSRSEGGPRAILETSMSNIPIISTPVGLAKDVLNEEALITSIPKGIELVVEQFRTRYLNKFIKRNEMIIRKNHSIEKVSGLWKQFYNEKYKETNNGNKTKYSFYNSELYYKVRRKIKTKINEINPTNKYKISIWKNEDFYFNESSFKELLKELKCKNIDIVFNHIDNVDAHLVLSNKFNDEYINKLKKIKKSVPIIHLIQSDINRLEKRERENLVSFNKTMATITLFDNYHNLAKSIEFGIKSPTIIPIIGKSKSCNVFENTRVALKNPGNRFKIVSIIWNLDNEEINNYKIIDRYLDTTKYEFTLISNHDFQFKNIKSKRLINEINVEDILSQHDLYFSGGEFDPSNSAIVEALAQGLPVIYTKAEGNSEIVGLAGLALQNLNELELKLEILKNNYEQFTNVIYLPNISQISEIYLKHLRIKK